jgi:hypothetical protein
VQGTAGFGLTNSVDGVAMTGAVAPMVLVGVAVGWRQLCTTGSVGRCMGNGVDAVLFRVPAGERGGLSVARGRRRRQPLSCTVRDEMEKKEEKTYVCEGRAAAGGRAREGRGQWQCCGRQFLTGRFEMRWIKKEKKKHLSKCFRSR